jgi:hypothetical protein
MSRRTVEMRGVTLIHFQRIVLSEVDVQGRFRLLRTGRLGPRRLSRPDSFGLSRRNRITAHQRATHEYIKAILNDFESLRNPM